VQVFIIFRGRDAETFLAFSVTLGDEYGEDRVRNDDDKALTGEY
jgi:hypothetical protein